MTDGSRKSDQTHDTNVPPTEATPGNERMKLTDLTVVLDRSGSMKRRQEAAMTSFNDFLEEHRALPDRARLSLNQFDHLYEPVAVGARLEKVEP